MVILDIILRGKLGYTYSRVMLRDNKFNEALLQSDTGRQSRNKKATKDSLDLPFLFKETAGDSVISLLVIQWKCFLLNVFLSLLFLLTWFHNFILSQSKLNRSQVYDFYVYEMWEKRHFNNSTFNQSQIDKLNWFVS